ncbi:hypothetical protein CMUS01_06567 [Colletotrichum musicola]|uniref:Uncharacterized protein n=1 Tax=Colletotrichum musicola TaxID=2175873 RepID=A0A8H6NHB4_9PEZI|nr:hypothetical protein CMUS01_06567 [Colletotrichum musicola]
MLKTARSSPGTASYRVARFLPTESPPEDQQDSERIMRATLRVCESGRRCTAPLRADLSSRHRRGLGEGFTCVRWVGRLDGLVLSTERHAGFFDGVTFVPNLGAHLAC